MVVIHNDDKMASVYGTGFRIVEHEADTGLEIYGRNLFELYNHGGTALFSLITDPATIELHVTKEITVDIEDETLVVFLNELLYLWMLKNFSRADSPFQKKEEGLLFMPQVKYLILAGIRLKKR